MSSKKKISIVAIFALLFIPIGIASAGEINVRNGTSNVIIKNGDIDVKNGSQRIYIPRQSNNYKRPIIFIDKNRIRSFKTLPSKCRSTNSTHSINQRSRSGVNSSYSSTQTTICSR